MDRRFSYIGAIPQDLDMLIPQRNSLKALGWLAEGVLGWNTLVDGLSCIPSVPASLVVQVLPGQIFQQSTVDAVGFGSMVADVTHNVIKQGIVEDTANYTMTPPGTAGYAQNYLVQAQLLEQDVNATVLPYFNPASLTNASAVAWSGPNNSGIAQPLTRQCTVAISLKPGTAATSGTQTTPTPDPGYVGLYAITVAQGQTQITSGNIVQVDNAPFVWLKLPQVPLYVQSGSYAWAVDTSGVANNIQVTLNPLPATIAAGFGIRCKVANANTGAATITINRNSLSSLGPYTVIRSSGSALISGDITSNQVIDLVFDGTSFRDITGTNTSVAVGSLTAQSGEGITVDGTAHVNLNFPGLTAQVPTLADLLAFYSQGDTHHRTVTIANFLSQFKQQVSVITNVQMFTASGIYYQTPGATKALILICGGGGSGGGGASSGGGAGATVMHLINLTGSTTFPFTLGSGGASVTGSSAGNAGGSSLVLSLSLLAGGGSGGHNPNYSISVPGGTASGGNIRNMRGGIGIQFGSLGSNPASGGFGGSSFFSPGGLGNNVLNDQVPQAGSNGSGGGAGYYNADVSGAGGNGYLEVWEF